MIFLNFGNMKYFSEKDFVGAVPSCKMSDMNERFLERLDCARFLAGVPFNINSAFRSVDYEISKGRAGTSSHCKGLAVDLACSSDVIRFKIVDALLCVGFKRIGIGKRFVHVDMDSEKSQCIWLY